MTRRAKTASKRGPKGPGFAVYPAVADLRRGKLGVEEFEDWLTLIIELDHVVTKVEKATLTKLYTAWTKRITAESQEADDDGGEDFTRFYPLSITDKLVQGGASRFIAAHQSCAWLVGELTKLRGVVSVAFGEPPDRDAPLEAAPRDQNDEPPPELAELELVSSNGTRTASLCFGITLFADQSLQAKPAAVLAAWHAFLALVPPGQLRHWGTETTAPINRKAVTPSTLGLLDKWLAKGAPKREYLALLITDEATHEQAPRWAFEVWSPHASKAGFVHLALPIRFGLEQTERVAKLAHELFATGAFRSGLAGPCWRCAPASSYHTDGNGHLHAVRLAERYPGIDLIDTVADEDAVGRDGIKNVGWLTFLDEQCVTELGGKSKLTKGLPEVVSVVPSGKGVMLRAGAVPTLDASGGERAIVARVAPLLARTLPRLRWMRLPDAEGLETSAFKLRLAPWPELAILRACGAAPTALRAAAKRKSAPEVKKALDEWRQAVRRLRAIDLDAPAVIEHREHRAQLVAAELSDLFTQLTYAAADLAPELALELYEAAVAEPGAPASLYGDLRVRQDPQYVLRGLIPAAIEAGDRDALRRHVDAAAARASEEPDIHHALARAFVFLGDHDRALDHVELAQTTYDDAKAMKTEPALAAIAKHPRFVAAFKKKKVEAKPKG